MKRLFTLLVAGCLATFGVVEARAQQPGQGENQSAAQSQDQQQAPANQGAAQGPIPAYRSPLAGAANNEEEEDTTEITPDNRSLTGVQALGLGMTNEHTYWQPHAELFESVDSNPAETTGHTSWGTWTSISAGVDIHKISQNNALDIGYVGGGTFSTNNQASNGTVQALNFSDKVVFHRWALTVVDGLTYLPESSFGFGGLGAPLPGGGLPGGGIAGPGQSLLVGRGQNLSNQFDVEADVFVTGRTSLTFVGGYSNLDYFDSDLLNYGTAVARIGYNYQVTRKDTLGADYTFSDTNYGNFHQSIVNHSFQVAYGRRVTGRLAFQIAAGPEIATFKVPITPGTGGGEIFPGPTTNAYWSLSTNLSYAQKRNSYSLAYAHGVGGGSGVLAGSEGDTVTGSFTRQMTRLFSSGISGGYSRNRGLAVSNTTNPGNTQTYDYWFGGGNLSYPLGRTLALSLTYQAQYQNSGTAFCIGSSCSTDLLRHMISVGLSWHDRPQRF